MTRAALVAGLIFAPGFVQAQEGEPMVIYGYAFTDAGDSAFVRLEWGGRPGGPRIRLAPFGRTPTEFHDLRVASDSSSLQFTWPGRRYDRCRLVRRAEFHWEGECRSEAAAPARPISLGGGYEPDLGQDREPTRTDVRILARARSLLGSSESWHRHDERVCDDDARSGRFSLFCALYVASLQVDGVYLHRRPAMRAVRRAIAETAPERISTHTLRDFNNHPETTFDELLRMLDSARTRLEHRVVSR